MIDLRGVVDFCIKELNIRDEVVVEVYLEDLTEDSAQGWCHDDYDDDFCHEIELEKTLNDEDMLVTLCHEMVHVRQFSTGNDSDEKEANELENILAEKYKQVFLRRCV